MSPQEVFDPGRPPQARIVVSFSGNHSLDCPRCGRCPPLGCCVELLRALQVGPLPPSGTVELKLRGNDLSVGPVGQTPMDDRV